MITEKSEDSSGVKVLDGSLSEKGGEDDCRIGKTVGCVGDGSP